MSAHAILCRLGFHQWARRTELTHQNTGGIIRFGAGLREYRQCVVCYVVTDESHREATP